MDSVTQVSRGRYDRSLLSRLGRLRQRLLLLGGTAAVAWGVIGAVAGLAAAGWLDLLWELSPQTRLGAVIAAGLCGLLLSAGYVAVVLLSAGNAELARRLDQAGSTGGQIITALELSRGLAENRSSTDPLRTGLAQLSVRSGSQLASRVPAARAVSGKPLRRSVLAIGLVGIAIGLFQLLFPGVAATQWSRFAHPFADVPPFSRTSFTVKPGYAKVIYGQGLDIYATATNSGGVPVDRVELVVTPLAAGTETAADGSGEGAEVLPMFPEADSRWRAMLSRVTVPATYYVRSQGARSNRYRIDVITVPRIESVRLRITPPAYAHQGTYEGPLPEGGIAGLPGTVVEFTAVSNRPLSNGTLVVTAGGKRSSFPLSAAGAAPREVAGRMTIRASGTFQLNVVDQDGQASTDPFAGTITLLVDQRPFVRLLRPRPVSLATPTSRVPVEVAAEDDCGISRLQLFRGLNDSRDLPMDFLLRQPPQRTERQTVELPLAEFGLSPGDTIRLFARVEDNDPAGAKGAESAAAIIHIISQEDFEQMVQRREGLNVLLSKYRKAARHAESLADKMSKLRKKLANEPPDSKAAAETRQQLEKLAQQFAAAAGELERAANHPLPFDLDQDLTRQLQTLSKKLRSHEQKLWELMRLEKFSQLTNRQLADMLSPLVDELTADRKLFDEEATGPLEDLARAFPLVADESAFVMLVMRQQDLAQRLASLKGRDNEDDPALKARMRSLEEEQRALRTELGQLLDEIENHVVRLPGDKRFDELRESATRFVKAVRESGASEAMAQAEAGLSEFSGTRAHAHAQKAADILKQFLKQGETMAMAGRKSLVFRPGHGLGNTIDQLLSVMGLLPGGTGQGSGGYSARRNSLDNVGLYGNLPTDEGEGNDQEGTGEGPLGKAAALAGGDNPDRQTRDPRADASAASSAAAETMPLEYRRKVGQYFQRVSAEVPDR